MGSHQPPRLFTCGLSGEYHGDGIATVLVETMSVRYVVGEIQIIFFLLPVSRLSFFTFFFCMCVWRCAHCHCHGVAIIRVYHFVWGLGGCTWRGLRGYGVR